MTAFIDQLHGGKARPTMKEPEKPLLDKEEDPLAYAFYYAKHSWFQQICPVRTHCFRCEAASPVIMVPVGMVYPNRRLAKGERDITQEVVMEFAKIDWKFQKYKSYCPACKGLGTVI